MKAYLLGGHRSLTGGGGVTRRATFTAAASALVGGAVASCSAAGQIASTVTGRTRRVTAESDAMNPTIVKGQVITADDVASGTYKPRRQDIVLVYPTSEYRTVPQNRLILRRVIGIPGDKVSCDGAGSPLMLNGAALKEPYLHPGDDPSTMAFDVEVPSGSLWLLGDHRNIVIDARYFVSDPHQGMIPIANVVGIYRP